MGNAAGENKLELTDEQWKLLAEAAGIEDLSIYRTAKFPDKAAECRDQWQGWNKFFGKDQKSREEHGTSD